jgi:pimeloyl-ACP methyl ester carboxylesterase
MDDAAPRMTVVAAGIPFSALAWGDDPARPLLLVHGITASAAIWWRFGPAFAATGRRVVAVDLPGHGHTGHWTGRAQFRETADDLVAFVRAAALDREDLQVVGHSWGAMVATNLAAARLRPARIVLLDPPMISLAAIIAEATEAAAKLPGTPEAARAAAHATNPEWAEGDLDAVELAARRTDLEAVRQILLGNGDWDAGRVALSDPAAAELDVRVVRGDPATGSLVPEETAAWFAERYGPDAVTTIVGAPHSPQATHPEKLFVALRHALD